MTESESTPDVGGTVVAEPAVTDTPPPEDAAARRSGPSSVASSVTWWIVGICIAAVIASAAQLLLELPDQGFFALALSFLVLGAASWVDVAEKRIPNVLTYPALGLGILIHVVLTPLFGWLGWEIPRIWLGGLGPEECLMGFGLTFLFGIVSFIVRGLGGGDVKLLFAMGALLGLGHVVGALFNGILIAALLGIVNWALNGSLIARLQVLAVTLFGAVFRGEVPKREEIMPFGRSVAPFGLSMFLGLILAQFVELHEVLLFTMGRTE